ncbi:hypothetical protein IV203_034954 [Nitzschia inconspicua]|uniref:Uncharacterized protein n=1 Tax=Nitzschia inconspicua TaxID=303405 RepID=A0A9K3LFB6_9STRA|nr:hypothetical protein IV203_034954 [Nitzschia inconspicua]
MVHPSEVAGYVPHPTMPVGTLRPTDMVLMLVLGAIVELTTRLILLVFKRKPTSIRKREAALKVLGRRVKKSRALGPPAFVETSKLERQELKEQRALVELAEKRRAKLQRYERFVKNAGMALNLIVFAIYYGIPMMEFSGHRVHPGEVVLTQQESQEAAISAFEACLFPLSYVGMGVKISKWGMVNPRASTGALLVLWSAQMTVGKIMDGIDALVM